MFGLKTRFSGGHLSPRDLSLFPRTANPFSSGVRNVIHKEHLHTAGVHGQNETKKTSEGAGLAARIASSVLTLWVEKLISKDAVESLHRLAQAMQFPGKQSTPHPTGVYHCGYWMVCSLVHVSEPVNIWENT